MTVVIGAGLSLDADPRTAGLAAGARVREQLGDAHADLAVVFSSGGHLSAPEQVLEGVREALDPTGLVGCAASGVLSGRLEVEDGTATAVWAASLGPGATAETFHCEAVEGPDGVTLVGLPDPQDTNAFVLLPDPTSFPIDEALAELGRIAPTVPVLGGLASAQGPTGEIALFCDDQVVSGGAVGIRFAGAEVLVCVSQGALPVGPELTITEAEDELIVQLAGRPALEALQHAIEGLDARERELVGGGLLLGLVVDPDKPEYRTGDFLVRGLLGADPASGAVAVGYPVRTGQVVRLHARDARSADRELRELLGMTREALGGDTLAGALMFTCSGRGAGMFGTTGHDAEAVAEVLSDVPAAGFFAGGELGPVGGEPALHTFTTTMAIFPS